MPTCSTTYTASRQPSCAARSAPSPHDRAARKPGPERVAHAGRLDLPDLGDRGDGDRLLALAVDPYAGRPERDHPGADPGEHLLGRPAGLLGDQRGFVLVGEQDVRAVDQRPDQLAVAERQLLGRVRHEAVAALPALVGVPEHRLGVVRADQDVVGLARPVGDRLELDLPRLAHRAGVEGRDLGVRRSRWCTRSARCAGSGETCTESQSTWCRSSQARYSTKSSPTAPTSTGSQAEVAQAEADVRRAAAAAYLEVVDQERDRQLVQLVDDEGVGELAREGHQMVGGDRPRDEQRHAADTTGGRR